jgi:hypothetical protein
MAIFDRVANSSGTCRQYPINWAMEYPSPRQLSMLSVITHELGHAIGGWSDDYANPNTVMQACPSGSAPSAHLYCDDMNLLRWDSSYGYGIKTDQYVHSRGVDETGLGARAHSQLFPHGIC